MSSSRAHLIIKQGRRARAQSFHIRWVSKLGLTVFFELGKPEQHHVNRWVKFPFKLGDCLLENGEKVDQVCELILVDAIKAMFLVSVL